MKAKPLVLLACLVAAQLAACGGSGSTTPAQPAPTPPKAAAGVTTTGSVSVVTAH